MTPVRAALVALALVTIAAHPAFASPPSMTQPAEAPPPPPSGGGKSEATAQALAIGGALLGPVLTMIGAGVSDSHEDLGVGLVYAGGVIGLLGPSAGHWYAGKVLTTGLGLRVAGAVAAVAGMVMLVGCAFADDCDGGAASALLLIGGGVTYLVGTIYDIATADDAARSWNHRHGYDLAPMPIVGGGRAGLGLALTGRF